MLEILFAGIYFASLSFFFLEGPLQLVHIEPISFPSRVIKMDSGHKVNEEYEIERNSKVGNFSYFLKSFFCLHLFFLLLRSECYFFLLKDRHPIIRNDEKYNRFSNEEKFPKGLPIVHDKL